MFDTYDRSIEDIWEEVAELKRRGVPVPKDLQERLDIVSHPDYSFTEVSKDKGPAKNPWNKGGFFDPADPAQAWGPPRKPWNTKGVGDWSPDTKGYGKNYSKDGIQLRPDAERATWDDVSQYLPDAPKRRISPDDAAGFNAMDIPRGMFNIVDDVISGAADKLKRGNKAYQERTSPALPGAYPGISRGELDALQAQGPEDPDRPVRDMEAILAGARNVWANPPKQGQATPGTSNYEFLPPPESLPELVERTMGKTDPGAGLRPEVSAAPPSVSADMTNSQPLQGPPNEKGPIPGLEAFEPMGPPEPWRMGESSPGFLEQGGMADKFFGALERFSPSNPAGQALLAASLGMMSAPGTYGNFGQAVGRGGLVGMEAYQKAKTREDINAYKDKTLSAQERMAAARDATEMRKTAMQFAGKVPEVYKEQMKSLEKMVENGQIEEAQTAWSKSAGLRTFFPGWVAGKERTKDDILYDQLESNPKYREDWLNKEAGLNEHQRSVRSILEHKRYAYIQGKGPPLSEDETRELEHLQSIMTVGTAAATVRDNVETMLDTPEAQLERARQSVKLPTLTGPGKKPETPQASDEQLKFANKVKAELTQELGRTPSQEELAARLQERWTASGR